MANYYIQALSTRTQQVEINNRHRHPIDLNDDLRDTIKWPIVMKARSLSRVAYHH